MNIIDLGIGKRVDEAVMEVVNPIDGTVLTNKRTGEPLTITLAGKDSDRYKTAARKLADRRMKLGRSKMSAAEAEAAGAHLLAACVTGWTGFDFSGEPAEASLENVLAVFKAEPFVKAQCDEFVEDRANYYRD